MVLLIHLMLRAMKQQSERWRHMKYDLKKSDKEIEASFHKPITNDCF